MPSYATQIIIHWDCYTNQNFHISRLHDFLEIQLCLTLHQNFPPPPDRVVTQYPCHWRCCLAACVRQACKSCSWSPRPPLCLLASVQYRRDDTTAHTCHTAPSEPDNRQSVLTHQNTMESLCCLVFYLFASGFLALRIAGWTVILRHCCSLLCFAGLFFLSFPG